MNQRRILHLWFHSLPLDLHIRGRDIRLNGPFAITREEKNAEHLVIANQGARKAGLSAGQSLADARAICPDLLTEPIDVGRIANLLTALRRWADQFSPKVEIVQPDALVIDTTGVTHLYGGEDEFIRAIQESLEDLNIRVKCGMADTPMAARVWARYSAANHKYGSIIPIGASVAACDALPVEALETSATQALHLLGLRTIGAVREKPSVEIVRRFGLDLSNALNRLIGRQPEPLKSITPTRPFATRMTLPEPIGLMDDVLSVVARIAAPLMERLNRDGLGALQFELSVTCPDTGEYRMAVGFSRPTRETRALIRQFRPKIEALSIPFGVDRIRLQAMNVQPIHARQIHLGADAAIDDAMEKLVTVLGNRLGFDRVRRPAPSQSHLPEAECVSDQIADNASTADWPNPRSHRPLRILHPEYLHILEDGRPPAKFEWRRKSYRTQKIEGPERIAPEWWSNRPGRLSDYYKVKTVEGPTLWLRRLPTALDDEWSVAGVFA